jgi:hypothetical protein
MGRKALPEPRFFSTSEGSGKNASSSDTSLFCCTLLVLAPEILSPLPLEWEGKWQSFKCFTKHIVWQWKKSLSPPHLDFFSFPCPCFCSSGTCFLSPFLQSPHSWHDSVSTAAAIWNSFSLFPWLINLNFQMGLLSSTYTFKSPSSTLCGTSSM